eukprot:355010-Rhodomonas_salina.1
MSGSEIAYGGRCLRCAVCERRGAAAAAAALPRRMLLPVCYAMSGTDIAYAAMLCPVLTLRMLLCHVRY